MRDKTNRARGRASTVPVARRSLGQGDSHGCSQSVVVRLNKEPARLSCAIIYYLLASAICMSQQKLVFAPRGIVDLGPVKNAGSGARYLAINGVHHISKCKSHSNGAWVCFNEFFAARVSVKLGLPVPPFRVVPFRGDLASTETWFCSRRIEPGDNPDAVSFGRLRNRDSLGSIAAFDLWLCNTDRKKLNLFVERFPDGTEKLFIIDHGHILLTSGNLAQLRSPEFRDGKRIFSACPELTGAIRNVNELASGLATIHSLTDQEIGEYIEDSPSEWIPDGGVLKDLKEYLLERRDGLQSILEADLGLFPNLTRGVA